MEKFGRLNISKKEKKFIETLGERRKETRANELDVNVVDVDDLIIVDDKDESDRSRDSFLWWSFSLVECRGICSFVDVGVDVDDDDGWRDRIVCWANVLKPLLVLMTKIKTKFD